MSTEPTNTGGIGKGWPDLAEPGVPAGALQNGDHWLTYPEGGVPVIGQWSPDSWSWIVSEIPDRMCPEEMDLMNYLGPRLPPERST